MRIVSGRSARARRSIGREILSWFVLFVAVTTLTQAAVAFALPVPIDCQVDPGGANDRPGQRDLTKFCVDLGDDTPWDVHTIVNFDKVEVRGANTLDVCNLFGTDSDAFANLAVCTTLRSSGADNDNRTELDDVRLFVCTNGNADKCVNAALVPPPYVTTCEVSHPDNDPFSPAAPRGPGDDYPYDSEVLCAVDFTDFGSAGHGARLLDACAFPSAIPNSDPEDCILFAGCTSAAECDDGNPCTTDTCDSGHVCAHSADASASCSDELSCNGAELCNGLGFCESAGVPESCDDGIDCTIDDCDELLDECVHDPRNSLCDDGAFCNGVEICDAGTGCHPGTPPSCADDVSCTRDTCNEDADGCDHSPGDASCDDGVWCNGAERCDAVAGCLAGAAPACDDGVACTEDACDEGLDRCVRVTDDSACSNKLFCDGEEICTSAGCSTGSAPDCDDGVACTSDSCDEGADLCRNVPGNDACDDGEFCNGVEICNPDAGCSPGSDPCDAPLTCNETTGECVGCLTDAECDNGVFCDGAEACRVGVCVPGPFVACDDGVACTIDSCDESDGVCSHAPRDAYCDNGLFCDGEETCNPATGCEPGGVPACEDGIDCTVDSCNESNDRCRHHPDDALCDNGRYCDGDETCNAGFGCEEGEEVTCRSDRYECSVESCDEVTDECKSDFSRCVCGDFEIVASEECEPPARAGTFEDCNNGMDDDGDSAVDCLDVDCEHDSGRGSVCDESCRMDAVCARVGRDPALIRFNHKGGHDQFWIHGHFPVVGDPDPVADGFEITISNGVQVIYTASLAPGDLEGNLADDDRFRFSDREARLLGGDSARGGLETVRLAFRTIDGRPVIAFRVRAYGDFSAATHREMNTKVVMGAEIGGLTAEWNPAPAKWLLRQRDF